MSATTSSPETLARRRVDIALTRITRLQRAVVEIRQAAARPMWHSDEVRIATVDQLRIRMGQLQRELGEAMAEHEAALAALGRARDRIARAKQQQPLRIIAAKPRSQNTILYGAPTPVITKQLTGADDGLRQIWDRYPTSVIKRVLAGSPDLHRVLRACGRG